MIALLDKNFIYNTFEVDSFSLLEDAIQNMAPSMVDYYFSDFIHNVEEGIYLNKSQVESMIYIGDYSLYKDYNENIYLELYNTNQDDYETTSLW